MAACLAIAILLSLGSGCGRLTHLSIFKRPEPCTFNPQASKAEIVAHVNRFVTEEGTRPPLTSWRAMQAKVTLPGMPGVPATVAVEAPSRVRIRAAMFVSNSEVADVGCNEDEIWMWHKFAPHEIVTIKHEHVAQALQQMPIPLDPDWMMEVLGVTPLDLSDAELRHPKDPNARWVDLVARRTTPSGEPIIRVVRFNLCHGQVVEHRIERPDGTALAVAKLGDYSPDSSNTFMLPHLVQIECPGMPNASGRTETATLRLELGPIHANPAPLADTEWAVPLHNGITRREFVPPGAPPNRTADPRGRFREPLLREASVESAALMDVIDQAGTASVPPEAYSPGASRSSSGQLPPGLESTPRPFPSRP